MTTAHVAHATRGRARLRFPSVKGDPSFFERLERELRRYRNVTSVKVNVTTGSVLVHHRGDFDAIARQAREQGAFELVAVPPVPIPLEQLRDKLLDANDSLRRRTKSAADLRSVAFAALLGGSIYQLARGDFLPAGGTMLMQALDLLLGYRQRPE